MDAVIVAVKCLNEIQMTMMCSKSTHSGSVMSPSKPDSKFVLVNAVAVPGLGKTKSHGRGGNQHP